MPAKRRNPKRRLDEGARMEAWSCAFDSEHDFFGDLLELGVDLDPYGRPARAVAEAAWRNLGRAFLATNVVIADRKPWALEAFGEPPCR